MKIISKYKDYYDFLQDSYGIDPLIVLDRRECLKIDLLTEKKITFFVGGFKIEGYFKNSSFYYGEKLEKIGELTKKTNVYKNIYLGNRKRYDESSLESYLITNEKNMCFVNKTVIKDSFNYNEKENCPILLAIDNNKKEYSFEKFPKLSDYNLGSFMNAKEIYEIIYSWLSLQKTKNENKSDIRTDIQKLEGKGFDKKTSFRTNI